MGLFSKKKEEAAKPDGEAADKPPSAASVPHAPSATELALIAERETSSKAYQRAHQAEQKYRVKRNATRARNEYAAAKTHLKGSCTELKHGVKASFNTLSLLPYYLRHKMEGDEDGGERQKKKLERSETKRKRLEEKMKKMEEEVKKAKEDAPPEKEGEAAAAE